MIWKYTALLGAGVLVAGLVPMSVSAHAEDSALAFVIGTAVGHAINNKDGHVHKVHRRHPGYGAHVRYGRYHKYQHQHRPGMAYGKHRKWQQKKLRAKRNHHGYDRDRRYDRKRHKRGHDRYRDYRRIHRGGY